MTTWAGQINSTTDDAADCNKSYGDFDDDGSVYIYSSGVYCVASLNAAELTKAGWRFQNVTVPQGTQIDSATLTVRAVTASSGTVDITVDIYGVDEDNVSAWADSTNNPKNATLTTASVSHTVTSNWSTPQEDEIDVTDIVQEILDRGGWSSGNALAFYTENGGGSVGTPSLKWVHYDAVGIGTFYAAKLEIVYGTGTNTQINIGDSWRDINAMKINIGDVWKDVEGAQINIGDTWKTIY